jgi:hypothetical protein
MIKQFKLPLFIAGSLLILMSSCKKEVVIENPNESKIASNELKTLVNQVKAWRDSIVSNKATGSSENNIKSYSISEVNDDLVLKDLNYEKAFINFDSANKKVLTIPIEVNNASGINLQLVASVENKIINGYFI